MTILSQTINTNWHFKEDCFDLLASKPKQNYAYGSKKKPKQKWVLENKSYFTLTKIL